MTSEAFLYHFSVLALLLLVGFISHKERGGSGIATLAADTTQTNTSESPDWQEITSAEEVWNAYPGRVRSLLTALDLNRPELEEVQAAVQAGDTAAACNALLVYYRKDSGHWLRSESEEEPESAVISQARQLSEDTVTFNGVTSRVPRDGNGGWEWSYTGPEDDQEFGYSLNGHQYFLSLKEAWKGTGNDIYVKTFDRLIRDWIIHNPLPAKEDSIYMVFDTPDDELDWRDLGEVRWRDLEAGQRLGATWPQTFYGFQQSQSFTPAARLLMLSSISEQSEYLKEYHKKVIIGPPWR